MLSFEQNLYNGLDIVSENQSIEKVIPTSEYISGIEIRLSEVLIINNHTPKIPPFPGLANIYLVSFAISDVTNNAISIDLKTFERVGDKCPLAIDSSLFYWKYTNAADKAPSQIHVFTSIVKSKKQLREVASILRDVNSDNDFKNLVSTIGGLLKTASNINIISALIFNVAGVVGKYLGNVHDKPLLTWVQSYTDLHGDFDIKGIQPKIMQNSNAKMELTLVVRDTK